MPALDEIVERVFVRVKELTQTTLLPVINATGVILHTNLGRAPLSNEAVAAMNRVAQNYSNIEFDLDGGKRGSRQKHVESILCQLTGAEAGLVVTIMPLHCFLPSPAWPEDVRWSSPKLNQWRSATVFVFRMSFVRVVLSLWRSVLPTVPTSPTTNKPSMKVRQRSCVYTPAISGWWLYGIRFY